MSSLKRYQFIFCFLSLVVTHNLRAQQHVNFTHLSPSSDNISISVNQTLQDASGNIWMVQSGGIYIYNGYNYKFVSNQKIFPNTNSSETIKNAITDNSKKIWIVSDNGLLTKYDDESGVFEDMTSVIKIKDVSVITSRNDKLWLATEKGSIYSYANSQIDSITTFPGLDNQSKTMIDIEVSTSSDIFLSTGDANVMRYAMSSKTTEFLAAPFNDYPESLKLIIDKKNRLWIGTETKGLFLYDIGTKSFIQDSFFTGNTYNIKNELFLDLYCDSNDFLWAGTDGGGLYKVNLTTGEIVLFTKQSQSKFSLSSNTVLNINEDNHKNIWITPNYGDLNILPNADSNIHYHEGSENRVPSRILSIYKTSYDELWTGTDGSGLTRITFNADGSTTEKQFFNDVNTNKRFYVQSITEDDNGNIWFGTYKNGLWFYNSKKEEFHEIPVVNNKNQKASDVRTVYKDGKGRLWIGSNTCLNVYSDNIDLLASFENTGNGLKGTIVESINETQNGTLWLGANAGGFFAFDENHNNLSASTFVDHSILNADLDRLKSIISISEGSFNSLWLINDSGKLLKYNIKKNTFSSFEHLKALSNRNLTAVINAGNDNLWISSNNGIINYNTQDSIIKIYYSMDGLQDNKFLPRSAFKDYKGILYFGGVKGINYFYPQDLTKTESHPHLQINSIEVLNQPAEVLLPEQINAGIANVKSLQLKHNQSSFSFRFVAIDDILFPKHFYAYRLKGFDDGWIDSNLERSATYTNIPAGNYTFEVKSGPRDEIWDTPIRCVEITIAQPFWNKPLAWFLYVCIVSLLAYGIKLWYNLKKRLFVEKVNNKTENELNNAKMDFFAKMSHEIQTPLTLILGPIDDMILKAQKNGNLLLKQRLNIIAYNSHRLSKIAYELTLVRNKEMDKLRLNVTKNDLFKKIEDIAQSFKELARKKQIDFIIVCSKNLNNVWYDQDKIEHIIYNLLSNAFKFTPKEGSIKLAVNPIDSNKTIKISVTDSGAGIAKEELNNIFELFYQSTIGKKNKGTGIGLALTKELIDLHKGKIEVESSPQQGTIFTITFPINQEAYLDTERIWADFEEEQTLNLTEHPTVSNEKDHLNLLHKTILIVEDTLDLQLLLKELLQNHYNVILAENGKEGYHLAKSNFPDLILSDIMMPELDGIEMCQKLQDDQLTKHIPVILMTAKNSTNSKISGLQSGAIEYINKPFNTNELLLKIQNILISKEHIISKYREEIISSPEVSLEKSQDEIFLENLVASINLRMEDANLKMEELADALNMSYSTIYRKCHALTGHSLVDFVRMIRLKKAAVLITKNGFSISETAFMTGFNDPKYFSKCFKKQFKKTPVNFKKEAQKYGVDAYLKKHQVTNAI